MPDLRARLVALLYEHQEDAAFNLDLGRDECRCGKQGTQDWREHFADVLLSLEGVAIVAVPEGAYATVRYDRDALIAILNAKEAAEAAADAAEAVTDA